jgi:hypothetical protein
MCHNYKLLILGLVKRVQNDFSNALDKVLPHRPDGQKRVGEPPIEDVMF